MKLSTGRPCPACGFTRATLALLHGELSYSFKLHPLVVPVIIGVLAAVTLAFALPEGDPRFRRYVEASTALAALGFVLVWALRLAGVLLPV